MTPALAQTDLNDPSTDYVLRVMADSLTAQPNETAAEYEERVAAAASAWRAFNPRDPLEQWAAGELVATHHAALDNLTRAMETPDNGEAVQLRSGHAGLVRSIASLMRQLEKLKQRPAGKAVAVPKKTSREISDEALAA